ncbi:hypothetical protein HNV12_16255 [Methanococcoides sp. SA1]|nr:hypothetical protein [Methanococcoides sp. SA1]
MNRFGIKEFRIRKFNSKRYLGMNLTTLDQSLLIYGEHKSGKSTTIDALAYAIFGTSGSMRPINNIADTSIKLSNDDFEIKLKRKANTNHELTVKRIADGSIENINERHKINDKLVELFNLPNHDFLEFKARLLYQNQDYTIKSLDQKKLVRIISYYTGLSEKNKEIENIKNQIKDQIEESEFAQIKIKEIKSDQNEKRNFISESKNYIENLKQLISSYEDGKMQQIYDLKKQKSELWKEIDKIQSTNIYLLQEKKKLYSIKSEFQKYFDETLLNLVKDIISVLICPVCGKKTSLSKVELKYKHKKCPYCGDEHYDNSLYDNISHKINISNEKLPEINAGLNEINAKLENNYQTLNELKLESNILEDLVQNPMIVRNVEKYDSLDDPKFKIFINQKKDDLNRYEHDLKENENEITSLLKALNEVSISSKAIDEKIKDLQSKKEKLQEDLESESFTAFLSKLNYYYGKLMGYKKQPIILDDGKLFFDTQLRGNYKERDDISTSKTIGESEKRCLNAALLFTFLDLDAENSSSLIDFVFLDDPAEGLYDDIELPSEAHNRTNLLNLIKEKCGNSKSQFIILTADKTYNDVLDLPTTNINFNEDIHKFFKTVEK